jgi:hypothetical protein
VSLEWLPPLLPWAVSLESDPTCSPGRLYRATKVFVNGDWVGVHTDPDYMLRNLRSSRRNHNSISNEVSIFRDIKEREVHIYCDPGRICRPLLVVENSKLCITPEQVQGIREVRAVECVFFFLPQPAMRACFAPLYAGLHGPAMVGPPLSVAVPCNGGCQSESWTSWVGFV